MLAEALDVLRWLESKPSTEAIAERLLRAEEQAFLWHCVEIQLSAEERERFRAIAANLKANGYKAPGAA